MDLGFLTGTTPGSPNGSLILAAIPGPAILGDAGVSSWLPPSALADGGGVDGPFFGMYVGAALAVILVTGLALAWVGLFRRKDETARGQKSGAPNPLLLGLWLLGAIGLTIYSFTAGFGGFLDAAVAPAGSYDVMVTARQGDWDFTYPNGYTADTLHVAAERPIRLTLASEDVIHALSVPALRLNQGILPDRSTQVWFEAARPDTYGLRDALYTGEGTAAMVRALIVHDQAGFEEWLNTVSDIFSGRTLAEVGELLYNRKGCAVCHTTTGAKLVGPSFKDVYGHTFTTREGGTVVVDDAYIRESILTPNVSVIAGYEPVMTPYEGKITDREIEAITEWLKTLSSLGGTAGEDAAPQEEM